jgi:hypothetical protein
MDKQCLAASFPIWRNIFKQRVIAEEKSSKDPSLLKIILRNDGWGNTMKVVRKDGKKLDDSPIHIFTVTS